MHNNQDCQQFIGLKQDVKQGSEQGKANRQNGSSTLNNSRQYELERVLDRLWQRMGEMYGQLWVTSFGDNPNESWAKGISNLSNDEIRTGLDACLNRPDKYPPTLPEFKSLCKPQNKKACHKQYQALPKPLADKNTAFREICNMKRLLVS